MVTKVYYLDKTIKNFREKICDIKRAIPCHYNSKPVEMGYAECTFEVKAEDVPKLEKMIAPLV